MLIRITTNGLRIYLVKILYGKINYTGGKQTK